MTPHRGGPGDPGSTGAEVLKARQTARGTALVGATITMGLVTGAFALYAHTIMPGLADVDDRTFVGAFQALDKAIVNPWFMISGFLGALVFTGMAVVLHLGAGARSVLPWVVAALVLYLAALVITIVVHVPLNDQLKAAGDPDRIADLARVREQFDEAKSIRWNYVRAAAAAAAFGCLCRSLVLHRRA